MYSRSEVKSIIIIIMLILCTLGVSSANTSAHSANTKEARLRPSREAGA